MAASTATPTTTPTIPRSPIALSVADRFGADASMLPMPDACDTASMAETDTIVTPRASESAWGVAMATRFARTALAALASAATTVAVTLRWLAACCNARRRTDVATSVTVRVTRLTATPSMASASRRLYASSSKLARVDSTTVEKRTKWCVMADDESGGGDVDADGGGGESGKDGDGDGDEGGGGGCCGWFQGSAGGYDGEGSDGEGGGPAGVTETPTVPDVHEFAVASHEHAPWG